MAVLISRAVWDRGAGNASRLEPTMTVTAWRVATAGTILVGTSYAYPGAHWPTDVLAEALIGSGTVMVWSPLVRGTLVEAARGGGTGARAHGPAKPVWPHGPSSVGET